jgi:phosphonate transport system substrate-binding protein
MLPVYRAMMRQVSTTLGIHITLHEGAFDYQDVLQSDLQFICGLPYIRRTQQLEAIAAPILQGERYRDKAIYFSDVIVHRDSDFQRFEDLRGRMWAYNEPESQSGYGITRYTMVKRGLTGGFFGQVIEAGYHERAIRMVCDSDIDAAAIDSHVLAFELRENLHLAEQIRVIDTFGPSTIQPICVSRHMDDALKHDLQNCLTTLHEGTMREILNSGLIDRLTVVADTDYDDIRGMFAACEQADFLQLR